MATMQVPPEASDVRPQLELKLDEYKVTGGSIGYGRGGTTFAFTVGPLSASTVAVLDSVAEAHGRICVYCCRQPLLLDLVALERKEPSRVRIVGRMVAGASAAIRTVSR